MIVNSKVMDSYNNSDNDNNSHKHLMGSGYNERYSLRCSSNPKLSNRLVMTNLKGVGVLRSKYYFYQKIVIVICFIVIGFGVVIMIYHLILLVVKIWFHVPAQAHAILMIVSVFCVVII